MKSLYLFAPFALATLSACADIGANYTPILDGQPSAAFQSDLLACQNLAHGQSQFDQETIGATVAGGLLGAAIADHDGSGTAVEGLIGGALAGFVGGVFEATDQRKAIVIECMRGRAHRVVG